MEPGKSDGKPDMNAAASRVETKVIVEDRIARIESDVAEIKDDVKTINIRLNESIVANAREFGTVRVEIEKNRTEIQEIRTTIESAKLSVIVIGVGIIAAIIGAVTTYLHTVKII